MAQIPKIIHSSWHEHLQPLFDDTKLEMIRTQILIEPFYPEKKDIFRVFEMPLPAIKVVILGQDPYANRGQANGLAFAVNVEIPPPPSLRIIHNEIVQEKKIHELITFDAAAEHPAWNTLYHWHKQGVFLLNSALTVKAGMSSSHLGIWQWFTREVIRIISIHNNPIWLMWGAKAKGYIGMIHDYYKWTGSYRGKQYNYVLEADHPAAETYNTGGKYHFSGCGHFSECNKILQFKEQAVIQW